jgi:hypothetical protein
MNSVKQLAKSVVPGNYYKFFRVYKEPQHMWFYFQRKILKERLIVVVGTGHRVGSTWLYQMLGDLGHFEYGGNQIPVEFEKSGTIILELGALEYLHHLPGYKIFKSHSLPPASEKLTNSIKFVSIVILAMYWFRVTST